MDTLMCKIRVNCTGAIAKERSKMMYFSRLTGLQNNRNRSSLLRPYQMLLQCGYCQKRRDCHMVLIHATVRQNQDVDTVTVSTVCFYKQTVNGLLQAGILIISNREHFYFESRLLHIFNLQKVGLCQNRIVNPHNAAVLLFCFQKVAGLSNINRGRGYDLLTDGINRRVSNLCKQLFEIIKQRLMML